MRNQSSILIQCILRIKTCFLTLTTKANNILATRTTILCQMIILLTNTAAIFIRAHLSLVSSALTSSIICFNFQELWVATVGAFIVRVTVCASRHYWGTQDAIIILLKVAFHASRAACSTAHVWHAPYHIRTLLTFKPIKVKALLTSQTLTIVTVFTMLISLIARFTQAIE